MEDRWGWIVREVPHPDEGIDVEAEVYDANRATGRKIGIQVKSGRSYFSEVSNGCVVFRFKKRHFEYWSDYQAPCVVILHDPSTDLTIWQRLDESTMMKAGKRYKVLVPKANDLSSALADLERLSLPKPLLEIRKAAKALEALDPRFRVDIEVRNNCEFVTLSPTEDCTITYQFQSERDDLEHRLTNMIEKGEPATFLKGEVRVLNSALFQHPFDTEDGPFTLAKNSTRKIEIALECIRDSDGDLARIEGIRGSLVAGSKSGRVEAQLDRSPLSIVVSEMPVAPRNKPGGIAIEMGINFNQAAWEGKPILNLPEYERLFRFFSHYEGSSQIGLELIVNGQSIRPEVSTAFDKEVFGNWGDYVRLLDKARHIAAETKTNPILPRVSTDHAGEIEFLYDLLTRNETACPFSGRLLNAVLTRNEEWNPGPSLASDAPFQVLLIAHEKQKYSFLDEEVEIGPIQVVATRVTLRDREAKLIELQRLKPFDSTPVEFETARECQLITRLATSAA